MSHQLQSFVSRNHPVAIITAFKMSAAGLIGFFFVEYFHLAMGVWCLVTIAAVVQTGLDQTLAKSLMRAIGTIVGALLGYAIALFAKGNPITMIALVFTVIFLTSSIALQPTIYSYAGIVTGMTLSIIVFFSLAGGDYYVVAVNRTIEVLLGIAILAIVNFILFYIVKKFFPGGIQESILSWKLPQFKIKKQFIEPSLKVASACIFTFMIWYFFKQPQGYWGVLTCLLIMEENQIGTLKKGLFRFTSHFFAAVFGLICVLSLMDFSYVWRIVPLFITFFVCGFLIGTKNKYASMGNTLGIAISIMLLSDPNSHETIQLIFARFYNVMIGIAVAFTVLFFKFPRYPAMWVS